MPDPERSRSAAYGGLDLARAGPDPEVVQRVLGHVAAARTTGAQAGVGGNGKAPSTGVEGAFPVVLRGAAYRNRTDDLFTARAAGHGGRVEHQRGRSGTGTGSL